MSIVCLLSKETGRRGELFDLAPALVDPEVRRSRDKLEALLHPEFIELGSSGDVYDRQTMVDTLCQESSGEVIIRDFESRKVSKDAALVIYRSIGPSGNEARRSSLWVKEDGK